MTYVKPDLKIMMDFSDRFSRLVEDHADDGHLNQNEVGKLFGVSGPMVHKWRRAKSMPKMANACLIALRYQVAVEWLMTGRGDKVIKQDGESEIISILRELSPSTQSRILENALAYQALEQKTSV